jgi:hypothetical protein
LFAEKHACNLQRRTCPWLLSCWERSGQHSWAHRCPVFEIKAQNRQSQDVPRARVLMKAYCCGNRCRRDPIHSTFITCMHMMHHYMYAHHSEGYSYLTITQIPSTKIQGSSFVRKKHQNPHTSIHSRIVMHIRIALLVSL